MSKKIIITIDGWSSCGKSTLAKQLATALGYVYIDSGAMYRAITLYFLRNHIDWTDEKEVVIALENIILDFQSYLDKNNLILLKKIHHIYKKNFKLSQISKKKYYFFIAFYILKEHIKWNINIFATEYLIIQTNANINRMYENIIKNIESSLSYESKSILSGKMRNDLRQLPIYFS